MLVLTQTPGRPPLPRLFVISGRVHVSQYHFTRIDPSPFARTDKVHAKFLHCVGNFSHAARQCSGNSGTAFVAVHRGQRLDPALGLWNHTFAARTQRTRKQPVQPFCRKVWQVAGDDQIPARVRCCQSGGDSRQRPTPGSIRPALSLRVVRYRVQSELRVSTGRSDNCDFGDEWFEQSGCMKDQRDAPEIEKSLVAAHARTGAPRKNEASDLVITLHHCQSILRPHSGLAQRSGGL
jgi:hypothetical protein